MAMPLGNARSSATRRAGSLGSDEDDEAWCRLTAGEAEADVVDVRVAARVNHDVVPWLLRDGGEAGMVTIDPSGSRRSNRRCAESTTSKRPSGRKSMHIGNDATWAMTSWPPLGSSAIT
jgi:hypothetical protein